MRKDFFTLFTFGLLGGFLGAYFFTNFISKYSANISQATAPTPAVSELPRQGFWEKIISESSSITVGIQVFQADRLVRHGSGVIISSDGLIVTTADLFVLNANYQIFYDDKILRGIVVARNYETNLMLIKTENAYSNIADLSINNYNNGQEIVLVGKLIDLSKPVLLSQRGILSYITDKKINIDTAVNKNLYGSGAIDSNGKFMGLTYLRNGAINLIRTSSVEKFFQEYSK